VSDTDLSVSDTDSAVFGREKANSFGLAKAGADLYVPPPVPMFGTEASTPPPLVWVKADCERRSTGITNN